MDPRPSHLESLPKEIVWMIIDCAPDSVLNLRLASKVLHGRVFEHTIRVPSTILVRHLSISSTNAAVTTGDERTAIEITISVSDWMLRQFCRRLMIRSSPIQLYERLITKKIEYSKYDVDTSYILHFDMDQDDAIMLDYLRECMGRCIRRVDVHDCNDRKALDAVSRLLHGTYITLTLQIIADTMSCEASTKLLEMLSGVCRAYELKLRVGSVEDGDPVKLLLDLSNLTRQLYYHQPEVEGMSHETPHLFGTHGANWPNIIGDMFARQLRTLVIYNPYTPGYLNSGGVDVLRETLPTLGKQISLTASCQPTNIPHYSINNHSVEVKPAVNEHVLHSYGIMMMRPPR